MAGAAQDTPGRGAGAMGEPAPVLVWDTATRLFHWGLVAAVLTAWFTGGSGHIAHEISGCVAAALIAFRLIWGVVGTRHARFSAFVTSPVTVVRYLLAIACNRAERHLGHNPAGAVMIVALLAGLVVIVVSGVMMLTNAFFGVDWVETLHRWSAYALMLLIPLHVLGVVLASRSHRENLVGAMVTGRKMPGEGARVSRDAGQRFRDDIAFRIRGIEGVALLLALTMGGLVYGLALTASRGAKPAIETIALEQAQPSELKPVVDAKNGLAVAYAAVRAEAARRRIDDLGREVNVLKSALSAQDVKIQNLAALASDPQVSREAGASNLVVGEPVVRETLRLSQLSSSRSSVGAIAPGVAAPLDSSCTTLPPDNGGAAVLKFARNETKLEAHHRDPLDHMMELAAKCPNSQILVTGYSDLSGSAVSNLKVSQKRAEAAAQYLTKRGIEAGRLMVSARGSTEFVAGNTSAEGRARNRRVEIALSVVR
jgi:cytochrome b/outer membrane protein OmpA-like peptidoglycan-associated protein